ncbi:MAG: hypothetical protein IPJ65_30145 [Archangiaceae bacterium]|nr:hypothetical protein [Archangiaceae bacterium]
MQSLKDKLLKAGLVTQEQAKATVSNPPRETAIPKLPPLPGSPAAQRQQSQKQLETDRKVREKVLAAQVPLDAGATTFYFVTRKGKARRLDLSEAQAKLLESGQLAVVERPDPGAIEHALVPVAVALELKGLSEKVVRFLNHPDVKVGFDDDSEPPQQP